MESLFEKIIVICFIILLFWFVFKTEFEVRDQAVGIDKGGKMFKGLCLFDIDGTLTTGQENEKAVAVCLDAGYAVGVSTAGSVYKPSNLLNYSWMPRNLYDFMSERNFDTFNNVSSGILMGENDIESYNRVRQTLPQGLFWPGWLKGFALMKTANSYGITDTSKMVMFDDDKSYLAGLSTYNNGFKLICAGKNCGGELTESTAQVIH
tara:strand:- start:6093 stop:6713 length:621 start_codon:yes stop_codon:yes gene_type:complete